MRTRSLLAVLVLGASSSASAQPVDAQPVQPPQIDAQPVQPPPVQPPPAQADVIHQPYVPPPSFAAAAQGPPSRPPMEFASHLDSSLATGIVDLSIGVSLVAFGALLQDKPESGSFLGAGLGTLAVGVPMLVVGTQRVKYPRHSEPTYAFGAALASMGGTLTGLGVGLGIGLRQEWEYFGKEPYFEPDYGPAYGVSIAGALVGLAGAGFMTFGANQASPEDAALMLEERREEVAELAQNADADGKVPQSVARRTAGQVLVTIGATSFTGALISGLAQAGCSGDFCGFGQVLITLPLAGQGLITTAIGIPLWVSGDTRVSPEELVSQSEDAQPVWTPEVNIGAGNLAMTMRF